ncbi:host specificity factor TipJ family phage tail protein, partial [Acinetobacter baumannii]|uniref:host specificity factor TipJ family phage tail protein n=1 Tax=Acinetobacter baumannii TaxID=470 RepID=UPI0032AEEC9F
MIKIIYKQDPLSEDKTIEHAETLGQWLTSKYDYMPEHVRIFHTTSNMDHAEISFANEVTPKNAYELKQLDFLPGTFIVIENPKGIDPITLAWIAVASIVMGVAVALLMPVPSITQTNQNNNQSSSANNELSNRENKTRVNGRIADIYGAAHDTPDLITVPYKVYENNVEVEHVVGCIGRGHYKINGAYDGETNIVDIAGASVEVFRPGVDIVSGEPYFSLGTEITTPPLTVQHQTSVNGQVLRPADTQSLEGTNYLHFAYPNEILRASANNTDLTTKFVSNDRVEITNASFTFNGQTYDLNGTYSVLSVADDRMTLSNPAAVNANWLKLKELNNQQTAALSPKISSIGEKWIGPFILDNVERSRVLCNFVATNGLYTVSSGGYQAAVNVTIEVEVTPVNESGAAIGNPMLKQIILKGSAKSRQTVGATLDMVTFQGRCSVRARRLTPTPTVTTVVDEVKWQALYGAYPLQSTVYEHETVFRARTYATTGALSVKSRKINFDLQRMLPTYKNGAMTTELYPTSSFADALVSMALDDKIGRRSIDEIDLENIYRTYNDVVDYFGTPLAAEFCTTIDDTNLSFEELVTNLCDAVFCTAYRQNNKLKLYFERPTDNSVMLFNFRNIIPDSYKHDLTFGVMDDYDGLIYEYTDPTDDSRINIYLPDKGAKNPKEVKSVGVRNKWQAHFNAYRIWNKMRFQRKSITFDAAPESELLVLRDRIAVADYRNGIHQSGEVVQQEGLVLTLSHDVDFIAGKSYVIYLQMADGTVDLIPVTPGSAKNKVVLGRLPNGALKLSPDDFVNTIYTVVNDDTKGSLPYLVAKREPVDQFSNTITAINYDERYYLNDKDFIDVPVDDSPIYIRYDQLDINLARLYQMQRGDLPTTGEISFVVESGALVSSSSSYRPETRFVYKFDYNSSPPKQEFIAPAATELPAIDTGEFPPDLVVNLTIKGAVVGRGGDGGLPHLAFGAWST